MDGGLREGRPGVTLSIAMKRRAAKLARRILPFLLLGAIVNIAIAWRCALFVDTNALFPRPYYSDVEEPRWQFVVRESLGRTSVASGRLMQINHIPAHPIDSLGWSRVSRSPDPSWKRPKGPVIDAEVRF